MIVLVQGAVLALLVTALNLLPDPMIFGSQPWALAVVLSAASLTLTGLLALPLSFARIFLQEKQADHVRRHLEEILLGLLIFTLAPFILTRPALREGPVFSAAAALLLGLSMGLGRVLNRRTDVALRLRRLAWATSILSALIVMGAFALKRAPGAGGAKPAPKRVIVLVIDSLSQDDLSPYNARAATPEFEALAKEGRLFTGMRSNFVATYHFFRILHSGRKDEDLSRDSLFRRLKEAGVSPRWVSIHNNGVPREKAAGSGLQSLLLTQNTVWFPRFLGLDYGIFWYTGSGGKRGRSSGARGDALLEWMHKGSPRPDFYREYLPGEVEDLRGRGKPFFLLAHVNVLGLAGNDPMPWEEEDMKDVYGRIKTAVKKADNAFGNEYKPYAGALQEFRRRQVQKGLSGLAHFMKVWKERGWDKDTLLIVTSDHGNMNFKKGLAWYAFHHEEEVSRVPLVLAGCGLKGRDVSPRETVDLTQTLLEWFGLDQPLNPGALSLLKESPADRRVTSLTVESALRKERFLSVIHGKRKWVVDLAKGGAYRAYDIQGFDLVPRGGGDAPGDLPFALDDVLKEYGLSPLGAGRGKAIP